MFGLLVLLFLAFPVVELYVIVQVAHGIGVLDTFALLVLVSIVGAWLVKFAGIGVLRRIGDELAQGRLPANELVDGFLVLFAGALLLTPGFVTDLVAILLLLPPTRAVVRIALLRRFRGRLETYVRSGGPGFVRFASADGRWMASGGGFGPFVDTEGHERRPPDGSGGEASRAIELPPSGSAPGSGPGST